MNPNWTFHRTYRKYPHWNSHVIPWEPTRYSNTEFSLTLVVISKILRKTFTNIHRTFMELSHGIPLIYMVLCSCNLQSTFLEKFHGSSCFSEFNRHFEEFSITFTEFTRNIAELTCNQHYLPGTLM